MVNLMTYRPYNKDCQPQRPEKSQDPLVAAEDRVCPSPPYGWENGNWAYDLARADEQVATHWG